MRSGVSHRICVVLMVVLNRVAYLRNLAQHGAKMTFSVSVNPATGVQQFKVFIDTSIQIPIEQQSCTLCMLSFLSNLCVSHRVADKGLNTRNAHQKCPSISLDVVLLSSRISLRRMNIRIRSFSEKPERSDLSYSRGRLVERLSCNIQSWFLHQKHSMQYRRNLRLSKRWLSLHIRRTDFAGRHNLSSAV